VKIPHRDLDERKSVLQQILDDPPKMWVKFSTFLRNSKKIPAIAPLFKLIFKEGKLHFRLRCISKIQINKNQYYNQNLMTHPLGR
jgi:hypothetical protein